jgi:hypothetical protein
MKGLLLIIATVLAHITVEAQTNTYYILLPKDELTQPLINQLKGFGDYQEGMFMQDDTNTLREVVFQQDTTEVYVVLSWEGEQEPSSIAAGYHLDSLTIEQRIFTNGEIKDYIDQNEHFSSQLLELE